MSPPDGAPAAAPPAAVPPDAGATPAAVWQPAWFASAAPRAMRAWRAVEAQHVVATMRLVDTLAEQDVLESLLEASKPALPARASGRHFLLATPFRHSPTHGSRFRRAGTPGIWYGAETVRTACAEVAYWRWRFLVDSSGLEGGELLTEHTVFAARVDGLAIDLTAEPWVESRHRWTHCDDYRATQALAEAAVAHGLAWLRYESVRDPGGACCAVFTPQALDAFEPASQQTWHCRTTRSGVRMVHGDDRHEWVMDRAGADPALAPEAARARAAPGPAGPAPSTASARRTRPPR